MNDFQIWFFAASPRSSASTSDSDTGAGRSSAPANLIDSGTASPTSSSSVATPSARNISASSVSSGPMWRAGKSAISSLYYFLLALLAQKRLVRLGVQQAVQLLGVADGDLDHPALVIRVLVDVFGRIRQRRVDLDHLAGDGGEQ